MPEELQDPSTYPGTILVLLLTGSFCRDLEAQLTNQAL